jgi:hypothetical protein
VNTPDQASNVIHAERSCREGEGPECAVRTTELRLSRTIGERENKTRSLYVFAGFGNCLTQVSGKLLTEARP